MTRLFDLDMPIRISILLMALSVGALFLALSYLLFDPVRALLADRQQRIAQELEGAKAQMEEARERRAAYCQKLRRADEEAEEIRRKAKEEAKRQRDAILQRAKEEAAEETRRARERIRREREQAEEQIRREIVSVAAAMAAKAAAVRMDAALEDRLLDEALREMEAGAWKR